MVMDQDRGFEEAVRAVLRGERAAAAISLPELSTRTGISQSSLQRYLTRTIADGRRLSFDAAWKIAEGLKVPVAQVVDQAAIRYRRGS